LTREAGSEFGNSTIGTSLPVPISLLWNQVGVL
jgi:hypothetical protein